jgi:hypothetical protein
VVDDTGIPVRHGSPLQECKNDIIDIIIKLGKIGSPLSYGQALHLINDLIDNTEHQQWLVRWKIMHGIIQSPDQMKTIGNSYWCGFL